jgi:hypothetical protein
MPPLGSHAGRNHAIFKTSAPLCIFVDDDTRIPTDFIQKHVDSYSEGFAGAYTAGMCAGGASDNARCVGDKVGCKSDKIQSTETAAVVVRVIQPQDQLSEAQMQKQGKPARYNSWLGIVSGNFIGIQSSLIDHIHECNFSAKTSLLREVRGFNETFQGNAYFEGADLALKLKEKGYRILYNPKISLIHLQDNRGGNRVSEKAEHTYWYVRNYCLLNSIHMKKTGLPFFLFSISSYVLLKSMKNRNPLIMLKGSAGLCHGLSYFLKNLSFVTK